MCALGEMAAWIPLQSGFTGYATRFCDPSLGFSLGYTYWLKYIVVAPNQLTAAALTIQYWVPREKINPGVFIAIFLVGILVINYLGVKYFGELEFWLSSLKILTLWINHPFTHLGSRGRAKTRQDWFPILEKSWSLHRDLWQ